MTTMKKKNTFFWEGKVKNTQKPKGKLQKPSRKEKIHSAQLFECVYVYGFFFVCVCVRLSIDLKYIQPPDRFRIVFIINFRQKRHNGLEQASFAYVLNNNLQKRFSLTPRQKDQTCKICFVFFSSSSFHRRLCFGGASSLYIQFEAFVEKKIPLKKFPQYSLVASFQHLQEIFAGKEAKRAKKKKEEINNLPY